MTVEADEARQVSVMIRKKWIDRLNSGQADLAALIQYSKRTDENKYIAQIRLITILMDRPDWSKATALEVLQRHGFNDKTTIRTLRKAPHQAEIFESILKTAADRWRARTEPPKGWPWSGKLSALIKRAGEEIPDELLALMEEDDEVDAVDEVAIESNEEDENFTKELESLLSDDDDEDADE